MSRVEIPPVFSISNVGLILSDWVSENIERDFKASTPTLDIIVDREKAYRYGVDIETIGRTVQYLIAGRQVGDFRLGNDIYEPRIASSQPSISLQKLP